MKKFTLLIFCLLLAFQANAVQITVDGITYDDLGSSVIHEGLYRNVNVVSVSSSVSGAVNIPLIPAQFSEGLFYFRVTKIANNAFEGKTGITSITMPGSVDIGVGAFSGCTDLKTVTMTNYNFSDRWIYSNAFANCTSLETITISNSVSNIQSNAFIGCDGLVQFIVDADNASYSSFDGVLYNKNHTTLVQYPNKKEGAFILPEGLVNIEPSALNGNTGVISVTIPASMVSGLENSVEIYTNAFVDCPNLASFSVNEANPVYSSLDGVVYNKSRTTLITCPPAKEGSPFVVPDGVIKIARFAFIGCGKITSISIPSSVTDIHYNSFRKCSSLTQLNVAETNPNYTSTDGVICNKERTTLVAYPPNKSGESFTIPAGVATLSDGAFMTAENLTTMNIPHGVTSIGDYAFWECMKLGLVKMPVSINKIGEGAFLSNEDLRDVYVLWSSPSSVTVAPDAFYMVTANCTLHVPPGTKEVYEAAEVWKEFATFVADSESSVSNINIESLQIYPNPVLEEFYITGLLTSAQFILTDISGRQILNGQIENGKYINIKNLPQGVYIVRIIFGKEEIQQKIIKR